MANNQVLFKLGPQANLNGLLTSKLATATGAAVPNAFYVTNDSHRLYFGITDPSDTTKTKVVPLNQGVISVGSVDNLPTITDANKADTAGQFYYVTDKNILCVYNGAKWVHINPDTDTYVTAHDLATANTTGTTNSVTVTSKITQNAGSVLSDAWTIKGEDHIIVSAGTKTLTIKCDLQYSLGVTAISGGGAAVKLTEGTNTNAGTVNIKGSNGIGVSVSGTNVTISGKTLNDKIDDKTLTDLEMTFDASGKLETVATLGDGTEITGEITPKVILGGDTTTEYTFNSGIVDLPVYTKGQVDTKFQQLDAVRYKGVISSAGDLPTTNVTKGDAYKLAVANVPYVPGPGQAAVNTNKVGDLLIANGTEGSDGFITAASLYWDYVPSGDDIEDTTYYGDAIKGTSGSGTHGLKLVSSTGSTEGQLTIQRGNNYLSVTSTKGTGNKDNNVKISHVTGTTTKTDKDGGTQGDEQTKTIKFVSGVTVDSARHLTEYEVTEVTLVDTNSKITGNDFTVSNPTDTSQATIKSRVTTTSSGGTATYEDATYHLISGNSNLSIVANGDNDSITFNLTWGSF